MIVGAQGYTIRDFVKEESGLRDSLKKLHEIGFSTLQVSAFGQVDPKLLREIADENKLQIIITHTNPDYIRNHTRTVIEAHQALGCRHVGIGMMPVKYLEIGGLEGMNAFLADFDPAARELQENGMKLHYHNHFYEYQKFDGKLILDWMAEKTDPARWGFILDVFWTQYGGRCPAKQIEMLRGRVDVCHLKDMRIVGEERRTAAIGDGNLVWDEVLDACEKTGVAYAMIEQDDTYGENPFDELKRSHDSLQRMGLSF